VGLGGLLGVAPLVCLNLLSALACALTVVPVVSVLDRVAPCPTGWVGRARPFVVALLGVHASLWEPASRIEVYPLGTLLGALSLACLLPALDAPEGRTRTRFMALAGLLLALTSGANAVTASFFALAMSPLVLAGPLSPHAAPARARAGGGRGAAGDAHLALRAAGRARPRRGGLGSPQRLAQRCAPT
jgi:hypothetical protein